MADTTSETPGAMLGRLGVDLGRANDCMRRLLEDWHLRGVPIAEQYVTAHGLTTALESAIASVDANVAQILREEMEAARVAVRLRSVQPGEARA